ncbi:hypothetical protein CDAR_375541 [Caerostris darwini]|uniref:Uncharacterized protein n=1 Tax=Caerostris darwini TaxID=1538125 RepID=A0AAV4S7J0_9ARAC|nr:hypothetical protein CDAR_375541 [Caerostris darwini]
MACVDCEDRPLIRMAGRNSFGMTRANAASGIGKKKGCTHASSSSLSLGASGDRGTMRPSLSSSPQSCPRTYPLASDD